MSEPHRRPDRRALKPVLSVIALSSVLAGAAYALGASFAGPPGPGPQRLPAAIGGVQPARVLVLGARPVRRTVAPGGTASFAVSVRRHGPLIRPSRPGRRRIAARVRLGVVGLAAGLTARIAPRLTRSTTAKLTVRTALGTPSGTYRVQVRARGHLGAPGRLPMQHAELVVVVVVDRAHTPDRRGSPFTIRGSLTEALAPGVSRAVDLELRNPGASALRISLLTVQLGRISAPAADAGHPCTAADFAVVQFSGAYGLRIPAHSTRRLSSLGVAPARWPRVAMLDRAVNQDGCKHATLDLRFDGMATEAAR